MMRQARVFVVRHGNTFAPEEPPRRIGARTDLPLVASGRDQATALGTWFAGSGIAFDRCLCSPLTRARETAAAIAPHLPIDCVRWLREIDHGPDEGALESEVRARIGERAIADWEERAVPPPGWTVDADERVSAWRGFLDTTSGTTLLVTSNGAARFALLAIEEAPRRLRTGAFGEIVVTDIGKRLRRWDVRPAEARR